MINRLKFLMDRNNVNKSEIANVLELNRSAITKLMKNERNLKINELITLVDFFNVSADYLLGIIDKPISPEDCIRARNQLKKEKSQPKLAKDLTEKEALEKVREIIRVLSDE